MQINQEQGPPRWPPMKAFRNEYHHNDKENDNKHLVFKFEITMQSFWPSAFDMSRNQIG